MENFITIVSDMYDKFASGGTSAIQNTVSAMSGYEMSEFEAFVVLIGASTSLVLWLLLRLKRAKKTHDLMEQGQHYFRT